MTPSLVAKATQAALPIKITKFSGRKRDGEENKKSKDRSWIRGDKVMKRERNLSAKSRKPEKILRVIKKTMRIFAIVTP